MNFRRKNRAEHPGFQIAPMIDVIFLLLCFFIASQIFARWETEIDVKLPTSDTGSMPQRLEGEIIINVLKDGSTVVNGNEYDDNALSALLSRIVKLWPGQPVLIRADRFTDYEHVIKVLDHCRKSDIWNISFATTDSEQDESG